MKSNSQLKNPITLLFFILPILSCNITGQGGSGNVLVQDGNYTINAPQTNITYTYNEIVTKIDYSKSFLEYIDNKIDSLDKRKKDLEKTNSPSSLISQAASNLNSTKKKKVDIEEINSKWKDIGRKNDEYLLKNEKIDDLFKDVKSSDFTSFIGLNRGDNVSKAISLFGEPTISTGNQFTYKYENEEALKLHFTIYSPVITKIELIGKPGLHLMMTKKDIIDYKYKMLDLKRHKIQEILGEQDGNSKYRDIEYSYYHIISDGGNKDVEFYFAKKDLTCDKITIEWY